MAALFSPFSAFSATTVASLALTATLTAAPAGAVTVPATAAQATELAALPGGGWLALGKRSVRLLAADGSERASVALRAKHLDTRALPDGVLATVIDANAERAVALHVDEAAGTLRTQAPFPAAPFGVEASCLYRDAQGLAYLYLVAKDGQAEQWLIDGERRQLVRKLALPPQVKHCRADDASGTLFASEAGMGLWAYRADAEGAAERTALALRAPFGKLAGGAGALALLPDGVAVLDAKGKTVHTFQRTAGRWQALPPQTLKQAAGKTDGLLALAADTGAVRLAWHDDDGQRWQSAPLARHAAPSAPVPALRTAIVLPRVQTEPVARLGDAADDPAIWVHGTAPAASRVLGTNKKQGLLVYDMAGRQMQLLEVGRLNNVDVRQRVQLGDRRYDLAMATQRDDNVMVLFTIDDDGTVAEAARFPTGLDNIYGTCLYQPAGGGIEAFINDKDGRFEHYRYEQRDGKFASTLLRGFKVASQPEGCVADDRTGTLFVGEERRGVWATPADAAKAAPLRMVLAAGGVLQADVEGMALYHGARRSYLVVSSQGDNSYVVLDAQAQADGRHTVRGRFRIGVNAEAGIDGASETDGLDVTSANLGGPFASGMLVVQDGFKRLPDGPQNFKYVAWDDIARALKLD